ncbi:hypothetical protein MEX01_19190 [Methylorubrum extorquens]|nr:hypothetical protein MEX01_19190 [Methylorubrum extorquens]
MPPSVGRSEPTSTFPRSGRPLRPASRLRQTIPKLSIGRLELGNREVARRVTACAEHPRLWRTEDQDSRFMGRSGRRKQGAEFLASWFIAEEPD